MAQKLREYSVLEILSSGNYGEACYKVKHKSTNSLLIWKAYDSKSFTVEQLNNISNEVKILSALKNDRVINYTETILHSISSTLYVVAELYPENKLSDLIAKCKNEHIHFEESFIWNSLYQLASISRFITKLNINILQRQLKTTSIFIDSDAKIKVDAFYLKTFPGDMKKCSNKVCEIGSIVYEMCTVKKYSKNDVDSKNFHYSDDLQNIINILLHDDTKKVCDLKPDILLHHPTVLLNLNADSNKIFSDAAPQSPTSTINNDSAFESDESIPKINMKLYKSISSENISILASPKSNNDTSNILENKSIGNNNSIHSVINKQLSPTLAALDLKIPGYVPSKVTHNANIWRSRLELCREPEEVCEEALGQVWLQRLEALREREEAVKLKEKEIDRNKIFKEVASKICSNLNKTENIQINANPVKKSMTGITLQSAMNQKIFNEDDVHEPLQNYKPRVSLSDGSVVSGSDKSQSSKKGYRRSSSVRTRYRKKKIMTYEDMNSSLSADQGDTSILPTSSKLSANIVPRPTSIHNIARRKVHFNSRNNPFAEYDSVSSTTLTFFEIENFNDYEIPKLLPPPQESIADRIAKFTYLDLEAMTNQKRALMEELRKTPPKINREIKPTLRSKVKAADNLKKLQKNTYTNNFLVPNQVKPKPVSSSSRLSMCSSQSGGSHKSVSSLSSLNKMENRRKTIAPVYVDIDFENDTFTEENKENSTVVTPLPKLKKDSKRRSILGFKTPFKFKL